MVKDLNIGDKVFVVEDCKTILTIKHIISEFVNIGGKTEEVKRFYFEEKHKPLYQWKIKKWQK